MLVRSLEVGRDVADLWSDIADVHVRRLLGAARLCHGGRKNQCQAPSLHSCIIDADSGRGGPTQPSGTFPDPPMLILGLTDPRMRFSGTFLLLALALAAATLSASQSAAAPDLDWFFQAAARDDRVARRALEQIAASWKDGYASMLVDLARLMRPARRPGTSPVDVTVDDDVEPNDTAPSDPFGGAQAPRHPSSVIRARLIRLLEEQTGKNFGDDLHRWREWMWNLPHDPHPQYATFKAQVYAQIDRRFAEFFREPLRASIRLDEVDWGGVTVNGIPPLEYPRHIRAAEARYLKSDHIVFGVYADGIARAYPKRILAWHELARDRVGSLELTLVYCTLCGTVIPYDSRVGGVVRTFGTSGLLYRSNKLMFDAETRSLWSSLDGTPVIGPLVGSGLRLTMLPVVTSTWGEWKKAHPETTVLSLETGHERDYSEGAAYREYFATDRLMFGVPRIDTRLKNKAEVLALRLAAVAGGPSRPVAVAVDLLRRQPVYHLDVEGHRLVVITTPGGANRVYRSGDHRFTAARAEGRVIDAQGRPWTADEDGLQADFDSALRLPRVEAHRAFWFGWYAQYPDTLLFK